jgi:hypothetical protein
MQPRVDSRDASALNSLEENAMSDHTTGENNAPINSQPSIASTSFLENGYDIRVSNQKGFLCKIKMKALIDLAPTEVRPRCTGARTFLLALSCYSMCLSISW